MMAPAGDGIATLTAPVAVRVLDVDEPLRDLHLSYAGGSQDYRSLLAIVRLAEDPIGVATFPVDCGRVTRAQLAGGVAAQLGPQLDEAYARRDLVSGVADTSMDERQVAWQPTARCVRRSAWSCRRVQTRVRWSAACGRSCAASTTTSR